MHMKGLRKMNQVLQLILIGVTFLFCVFILVVTQKKKLSYKYTLLWLFFGAVTLLLAIFPGIIVEISKIIHVIEPVNTLFLIYIFLVIVIIFYISLAFSKLFEKVTTLIQENAILSAKVDKLEKEMQDSNKVAGDKDNKQ